MKNQILTSAKTNQNPMQKKLKTAITVALFNAFTLPHLVVALPVGESVISGQTTVQNQGNTMQITQGSQQAIINWQGFNIANQESVHLTQPTNGIALYRVIGLDASQIYGQLSVSGQLFLVNPNGVLFGPNAQVNVGGLVASSFNISDIDFMNGRYQFNAGGSLGSVTNQGVIKTNDGGYVVLFGNRVNNSGNITANQGSVVMGSAQSAVLDFYGNGLVKAQLSGDAINALVTQSGKIQADGGSVQLATNARSAAINVSGITQANQLVERNGVISLEGGNHAKVAVSGTINSIGNNAQGGHINITGEQVALLAGANINASGDLGGGTVLVGGDYQGKNAAIDNARTTYVDKDARINVDANNTGDGGKVVVWADNTTRYFGQISAEGGLQSGDGGFVEVSGKEHLDFIGHVNVGALFGIGGQVLLDPQNIILNSSTQASPPNNPNGTADIAFADSPTLGTSTVQINDVRGFSELLLQATNDITINNNISMLTNNSVRLEANNNINVNAQIFTQGTGNIDLRADADANGVGDINLNARLFTRQGDIHLTGANINSLAAGQILTQGLVGQDSGNVIINASQDINLAGTIVTNGRNGTAGLAGANAGDVTLMANGAITTSNVTSVGGSGGTGNTDGGIAGNINITSHNAGDITTGVLTARNGAARGTGSGGIAGSINVNNTNGNITTGNLDVYGNTNGNGGSVNLNASAGDVNVTGRIYTYGGSVALGHTLSGTHAGNVTISGINRNITSTINTNGGAARGNDQAGGNAGAVSITGSGTLSTASISARTGNATNTGAAGVPTVVALNGSTVTTGGINTSGGTNAAGGRVEVTSTVGDLTVGNIISRAGNIASGNDGQNAGAVNLSAAGNVTVGTISANGTNGIGTDKNGGNGANVNLVAGGPSNTIIMRSINTQRGGRTGAGVAGIGGDVNINGNALLAANTTITATGRTVATGGHVNFAGTIDSLDANRILTINNNGQNTLNGAIGQNMALNRISINSGGSTNINGGSVTTTGTQTYGDATSLGAATTFTTNDSHITFSSRLVANGNNVIVNIGSGNLNATNSANNFNNLSIETANNVNIRDNGAIVLGATSVSGNYTMQSNASIQQSDVVVVGGTTTINSNNGDVVLNNSANDFNRVVITRARDVTLVDSNALNMGASSVRNLSAQTLASDITLSGNINASAVAGTPITFISANDFINTANNSLNTGLGGRWLVYSTNPTADVRGTTLYNNAQFKQYNTSYGDEVLGVGNGLIYRVAPEITVNLTGATSKVYDTNNFASISGLSLSQTGAIDGDSITLSALTSATYDNKNVGTNKTVNSNNLIITGQSNGTKTVYGYTLTTNNASGNVGEITPASLTINGLTASNKIYDANTNATLTGGALNGVLGLDNVSLVGNEGSFADKNVGNGKAVSVTGTSITGADSNNYVVTNPTGLTADITPASLTVSQTAQNKVYDTTTLATLNAGTLNGVIGTDIVNLVSGTASFADKNVGNGKAVSVTGTSITGADSNNYVVTNPTGLTANITPATIFNINNLSVNDKTYDATTAATINTNGASLNGLLVGDALTVAFADGNFSDSNAGANKTVNISNITLAGADVGNYVLANNTSSSTATITQRNLTVSADAGQSKSFLSPDPSILTYTSTGLVGGDTFVGALSRDAGESIGRYEINQGTLTAGSNYALNYIGAEFTINPLNSASPRDDSGLGSLTTQANRPLQTISILNVGAPSAAGESSQSLVGCIPQPDQAPSLPNRSILFNFGIKLPDNIQSICI